MLESYDINTLGFMAAFIVKNMTGFFYIKDIFTGGRSLVYRS
jgi:hypothetical protein